jgi:hypothetical protein
MRACFNNCISHYILVSKHIWLHIQLLGLRINIYIMIMPLVEQEQHTLPEFILVFLWGLWDSCSSKRRYQIWLCRFWWNCWPCFHTIYTHSTMCKKSLKISKGLSESTNRRTDNTLVKRKKTKGQTYVNGNLDLGLQQKCGGVKKIIGSATVNYI